ncbi:MAG: hypothetical protein AAF533_26270 [Acidobacteriota bacterium]
MVLGLGAFLMATPFVVVYAFRALKKVSFKGALAWLAAVIALVEAGVLVVRLVDWVRWELWT